MNRLLLAVASIVLIAACTVTVSGPQTAPQPNTGGWTRSANFTTCDQWIGQMTPEQRTAMAAPMLAAMRRSVDTAADSGAAVVGSFVGAITAECQRPGDSLTAAVHAAITSVAAYVFTTDTGAPFRP